MCDNTQVRADLLEAAVWGEVERLLRDPGRIAAEHERRLRRGGDGGLEARNLAAVEAQLQRLRRGIGRLIDGYAEGLIERAEFEPRVAGLRQRLASLEEQRRGLAERTRLGSQLALIIGRLEAFAARVGQNLDQLDRRQKRGLVRRVEIDRDEVNVVFRVEPPPLPPEPGIPRGSNWCNIVTGTLTPVWIPDPTHEAMRDLVRARTAAMEAVRRARQQLQGFLLRHGRVFAGRRAWSPAHRRWLAGLRFEHPAQQVVLQEQLDVIDEAERRRDRLEAQLRELVPGWSLAPVVAALQAMRGVAFLSAVVLAAEVGDFRRFANPRQLMAWLGVVPSEHSSGAKVERGGITKAGNGRARRVLVEGAWSYRFPARVTSPIQARLDGVPDEV